MTGLHESECAEKQVSSGRRPRRLCRSRLCRWMNTALLNTLCHYASSPPNSDPCCPRGQRSWAESIICRRRRMYSASLVLNRPVCHRLQDGQKLCSYVGRAATDNYRNSS